MFKTKTLRTLDECPTYAAEKRKLATLKARRREIDATLAAGTPSISKHPEWLEVTNRLQELREGSTKYTNGVPRHVTDEIVQLIARQKELADHADPIDGDTYAFLDAEYAAAQSSLEKAHAEAKAQQEPIRKAIVRQTQLVEKSKGNRLAEITPDYNAQLDGIQSRQRTLCDELRRTRVEETAVRQAAEQAGIPNNYFGLTPELPGIHAIN